MISIGILPRVSTSAASGKEFNRRGRGLPPLDTAIIKGLMPPVRKSFLAVALLLICLPHAGAAEYQVTISAGDQSRRNTPVCVPLQTIPSTVKSVVLIDPEGKPIPAQLTSPSLLASKDCRGEIHFRLTQLNAGETLSLTAKLSTDPPATAESFAWHDQPGRFTVLQFGSRPVLRYHYEAYDDSTPESRERTVKIFHHVFSPDGTKLLTGGLSSDPDVHSPHHRGIFFGYNRIQYGNGQVANTWHGWEGESQRHERFLAAEAGPMLGRHRVSVGWHGLDKQAFARETRELTAYHVPGGHLIDFASRLETLVGTLKLEGDSHHAGVQFRADNEVFAKTSHQTIYIRPDGVGRPGETRNWDPEKKAGPVNLPWIAMSFVLGDQRYTAAYLDHPDNPKDAIFSEREFGRFGSYFAATVDQDRPLFARYRFWVQDGLMTPAQVAALSQDFVAPVKITVTPR